MHQFEMHQPQITIIVPYYNRVNTLSACIDSILDANYKNIEILLIDDGSTDGSSSIGLRYASVFNNVYYFHQSNSGVSVARNTGLANAHGEWITFIDSDDVILPAHFDIVLRENGNADLLMVGATKAQLQDICKLRNYPIQRIERKSAKDYFMSREFDPYTIPFYCVWDKFFKLSVIRKNKLGFDEFMSLGEDQSFVCGYICTGCNLVRYTNPTYINVDWGASIEHLGAKLRSPSDYLHNQIRGYNSLKALNKNNSNNFAERYAIDFGIDRPISRILYNYARKENKNLIEHTKLISFLNDQVIPFIRGIDTSKYDARRFDIRITRLILLNFGPETAWCWANFYINYLSRLTIPVNAYAVRLYSMFKFCINKFINI